LAWLENEMRPPIRFRKETMSNSWKVLKTEAEYKIALKRTIEIFNAKENTPDGEELDLLLLLVKDYEDRHYHIPDPDPIEVIKLKLEERV